MILDAAMRLYMREGIRAITMESLAAEAQVTKPVVYACFPNRDAVLEALMDGQADIVGRHLAEALSAARECETIREAIRTGLETMLRSVQAEPDVYRASILLEHGATAELMQHMRATNVAQTATLAGEIEQWLARQGTPTTAKDARLVAHTVLHLMRGYIILLLRDDPPPPVATLAAMAAQASIAVAEELGIDVRWALDTPASS